MVMELVKGLEIRTEVLRYSLIIENFTSIFLGSLLNIPDHKKSKSLGNKSGNLSFNQKIQLLIDIQALDPKEKKKFLVFMSIRNQFMHNNDADCYESCFNNIDGADNFILKIYPQDKKLSKEKQLAIAFRKLSNDIVSTTVQLYEKVEEKFRKQIESKMLAEYKKNSNNAISEIEKMINKVFDKKIDDDENSIDSSKLKNLGSKIRRIYYRHMIDGMSKKKTE